MTADPMNRDAEVEVARLLFAANSQDLRHWDDLIPALQDYWLDLASVWIATHDWAAVEARALACGATVQSSD